MNKRVPVELGYWHRHNCLRHTWQIARILPDTRVICFAHAPSDGREIYLTFQVHNEAILVPEIVDCIRAQTGLKADGMRSIEKTNAAMGITKSFLPSTTPATAHVTCADVPHSAITAVRAAHAAFRSEGFKGAEEPAEPAAGRQLKQA